MKKRFCKTEKYLIAMADDKYTTYNCDKDGVFQLRNDVNSGNCPRCKKYCEPFENINELKEKYKIELGLE
jgi:hypothetical protein